MSFKDSHVKNDYMDIVTRIVRCVNDENSPTSRITEKRCIILEYSNKHETGNRKTQHLHKLTTPLDSKSRTITAIALSVSQLTNSQSEQEIPKRFSNSEDVQRRLTLCDPSTVH
ncbi:hypothetical protein AVEN_200641-1 [Araneus ventricosus]|uniref:Uncharacterized protein n=1 Tax=Araneus ventricosus TaxID=182803 RepID=A0A4Y2I4C6_ARAVE|nr:hypothetical protein AVEN_200641-1 [Araneus ventricosus]